MVDIFIYALEIMHLGGIVALSIKSVVSMESRLDGEKVILQKASETTKKQARGGSPRLQLKNSTYVGLCKPLSKGISNSENF